MRWNWEQPDWPRFSWNADRLKRAEQAFLLRGGQFLGIAKHLTRADQDQFAADALCDEALTTSEIEGELLNRDSVQSSIRRQLGLAADQRRARPAEQGVSEVLVDLHRNFAQPLDDRTLFAWQRTLLNGRIDLRDPGRYRTHTQPMQVVSGPLHEPHVHFEAPPSRQVPRQMRAFNAWFNDSAPEAAGTLPILTRAGIAHLHFESIHPFEDGNGRIGRMIAEKALAQGLGHPSLTALAATILIHRGEYYRELEAANKHNEVTAWLAWFAGITLEAQLRTQAHVEFIIEKTRLLDRLRDKLNARQQKVLLRVLREGPQGFKGGLSAGNYARIAKTSPATTTRDLTEMVELGALTRTGEKRHTRYHPPIPQRPSRRIHIDEAGNIRES